MAISQNYPALKPSLSLDFANVKALDPRITFSRASTATYYNANGLLESEASGVARFDHNPTTFESLGLLIEEQRTNLLLRSEEFDNAAFLKTGATVTSNSTAAPNGTVTADKLVEDTANSQHNIRLTASLTSPQSHTYSFFAKAAGRTEISVGRFNSGVVPSFIHTFTLVAAGSSLDGSITDVGNGWYRCSGTFTTVGDGVGGFIIFLSDGTSITYTGDGTSGIFIWGAQLEVGAFPTSYIPTSASQVTRAADSASMTGANFSSWFRADEGSIYIEAQPADRPDLNSSTNGIILTAASFGDAITRQYSVLTRTEAGSRVNRAAAYYRSPTVAIGLETPGNDTYPNGVFTKFATAMKAFDYAFSANGGAIVVSAVPDAVIGTRLNIGANYNAVTLNGTIKKIAYYPVRVTNEQLQGLTS